MPVRATTRTVAEVMSSPAVTAHSSESIAEVSARMEERQKGSAIVVDGERPIGILTERDLVRFTATGASASDTKVSEWMTQPVDTASPDLSVQEAFATFAEHRYRHLPVVEDGKLVGVVSLRSLMEFAQIQPVVHPSAIEAPPGLEGVIVAETSVGDVRGLEGFYHYRQYNAVELADKRRLEDVWHLLFDGELPTAAQRQAFIDEIRPLRRAPDAVASVLPA
ncbi:MAG: CBS domain-containing protein, partial [Acidimicrobiales bacterium]